MNLFKKEKGIVLGILNAVLVLWILVCLSIAMSDVTNILVKEYVYTYEEYELLNCSYDYETKQDCKNSYALYKLDLKYYDVRYKRNIIACSLNITLVSCVLVFLNKEKKKENKK